MSEREKRYLKPLDVARELGVKPDTVLSWIARRELIAADVSRGAGLRPRWRICRDDLDAFLARRRTAEPVAPVARRARSTDRQFV